MESGLSNIAYYRVSTNGQSIEAQRAAMSYGITFDKEFSDEGVSGGIPALHRPGFSQLMSYVREGDTLHVYAVDRLVILPRFSRTQPDAYLASVSRA